MARIKTNKTNPKKTAAAKKTTPKTAPKKRSGLALPELGMPAFFSSVSLPGNIKGFKPSFDNKSFKNLKMRRFSYFVLGLVILFALVYLAERYFVVAWVDNKPITRVELYKDLDQKYGKDMREQLIVQQLLEDEARNKDAVATNDEVNAQIKKIEDQQGGADRLKEVLQVQGINQDEFKKLVRLQILKEKIFGRGIDVSDDEVNKYVESNKQQFPEVTDKLKSDVKEQLRQQKINNNFNAWLKDTLQSSRIRRV